MQSSTYDTIRHFLRSLVSVTSNRIISSVSCDTVRYFVHSIQLYLFLLQLSLRFSVCNYFCLILRSFYHQPSFFFTLYYFSNGTKFQSLCLLITYYLGLISFCIRIPGKYLTVAMSFGACAELSRYFAGASIRTTSHKYSGSSQCTISRNFDRFVPLYRVVEEVGNRPIATYSSLKSMSRDRVVAGAASSNQGLTYKDAGVDIDAGSELVRRITKMAPGIGGFGGFFPLGMLSFSYLSFPRY